MLHLSKNSRFNIDAVMRDGKKAQDYANRHDIIKYYTDADAFINDPDIDATYEALKKKPLVCSLLLKDSASICANKKND
jgi:predicted dehydrogenase